MPRYEFTIGEVFPADDPVARWLVTLSVGLNDVLLANKQFEVADHEFEHLYFFRLASMHLWEAAKFASETYTAWSEIRTFVDGLSTEARQHFEEMRQIAVTGDVSTVGKELVQIRDLFGHYQEMDAQRQERPRDPLTRALSEVAAKAGEIEFGDVAGTLRLGYADEVIAQTVMRLAPETEAQARVFGNLAQGVGHVVQFIQLALNAWFEPRMDSLRAGNEAG